MMKTGLILIDLQNDYFPDGPMELVGIDKASEIAQQLLSHFREQQLFLAHVQHISTQEGAPFFLPDTKGVEIHESVKPLPGELIIQKNYPNSFLKTTLLDELKKAEIGEVVICGAMSHMCIDATVRAAVDLGFQCILIQDACATKDVQFEGETIRAKDVHCSFMHTLGFAYAKIMTFKEFMFQIKRV
jgi:nicotinamidase-related amidase